MNPKYEPLFTPFKIGEVEIPNRIVQCSMGGTTLFGWLEPSHFDEEAANFLLQRAKDGDPVDIWIPDPTPEPQPREPEGLTPFKALLSLLFPGLVSGAAVSGMAKQMKTANRQTRAENYIARGGVQLRVRQDQFYNRVVNRQIIRRASSSDRPSGGHYGGTTISGSHGGSHHSGKF
jgi:hypothetical protein